MICRKCGRQIIFVKTTGEKYMPCDMAMTYYRKVEKGKDRIITPKGQTISCEILPNKKGSDGWGYVPHWATCKSGDTFRRKK